MMIHKLLISLKLVCFALLIVTNHNIQYAEAQTLPSSIEEARKSGLTEEKIKSLGIDLSNPKQAAEKARQLGISEEEIQKALKNAGSDSIALQNSLQNKQNIPAEKPLNKTANEISDTLKLNLAEKQISDLQVELSGKGRFSGLKYYGYDVFQKGKGSVGPIEVGPVDPGYPIGAGDVIKLTLWGEIEYQYELTVDKEGTIIVPKAGQIFVAGTRLDRLRETLHNYLSKFYSGLTQDPPTIFMDVTLARLRSNQIYIMGEVERPGAYSISSYATAFNAMYAIGGPKISGSLREVRILREGKTAAQIDLYDYLLNGISTDDMRLQMNDIVFVPPRQFTVAIKGEILRPGIYEIKKSETLYDLVKMAGDLNPTAYAFRAQIDRIVPFEERVKGKIERQILDVNIENIMSKKQSINIVDGDIVEIFPINNKLENYVDINGKGIVRPGRYELTESIITISDLINAADGLNEDAYLFKADLVRTRDDLVKEFIEINLSKALQNDPSANIKLKRWDQLKVYSALELAGEPQVTISGFVKEPGTYPFYEKITAYDLIFAYAGLQDSLRFNRTYWDRGDILRLTNDGKTRFIISFNLINLWNQESGINIELQRGDTVVLYSKNVQEIVKPEVTIVGAVKKPGVYTWENNITLANLILKSDGFNENALLSEVEVTRLPMGGIKGDTLSYKIIVPLLKGNISSIAEKDVKTIYSLQSLANQFELEPNDRVLVKINPNYESYKIVTVTGEVNHPGEYVLEKRNETLGEIILRAGGIKSSAYLSGGQLLRNGKLLFTDFEKVVNDKKKYKIVLLNGDKIYIPEKPTTVFVSGEVVNPGYYQFQKNLSINDYLDMAGGKTENGGKTYINYASGYSKKISFMNRPEVLEGSTIKVLPKKVEQAKEKTNWSETTKEVFAIMSSAMMIIYLSKQVSGK